MPFSTCSRLFVVMIGALLTNAPRSARADEIAVTAATEFFAVDVGSLVADFDNSHIVSDPPVIEASFYQMETRPRVVVAAGAEAYLLAPGSPNNDFRGYRIVGTKPIGMPTTGKFFALRRHPDHPRESVLARFDFHVEAVPAVVATRDDFYRAKGRHFQRLWSEELAGSAMFRHLSIESLSQVGETARSTGPNWPFRSNSGVDATIQLMSGGRAVSENLQLDAPLQTPQDNSQTLKPLSEVPGIGIREIDWSALLEEKPTELDPLAQLIAHDQYGIFSPSFEALVSAIDRGSESLAPVTQWMEPQSRTTGWLGFYQAQLALPLDALSRQIGATLIDEVAITGSDPYFRTGTDVAVLMQSDQPGFLHQAILTQVAAQAKLHPGVAHAKHHLEGQLCQQWRTPDRRLSSIVARVDNVIVVTNSLHQMSQILKCSGQRTQSMHGLDEYRFFRQRYPRTGANDAILTVITDAAIRRWCGPQWRISASRRTRARAAIADVTMQHADELIRGQVSGMVEVPASDGIPDAGKLLLSPGGVRSEAYGTLAFQTPIAELGLKLASESEIAIYTNWRERYERRWSGVFDPIALQLKVNRDSLTADLSVIPLMVQSEYRSYLQLVGDVRLKDGAGDVHPESLASINFALDTRAPMLQFLRGMISAGSGDMNLLSWIDDSGSIYFVEDEDWAKRLADQSPWELNPEGLLRESPVGFFLPSNNGLRMAAFVVAARAALERIAPNLLRWETAKHRGFEYVVGQLSEPDGRTPRLYYITTPAGLTLSPSRTVIERVIDHQLANPGDSASNDASEDAPPDPGLPLGPQITLQASGRGAELMAQARYPSALRRKNRIAWSNIPILNHLRREFPDRDPASVYQMLWGETLVEPSGGAYVWNEDRGTYVSTLHGYHLEPKAGPGIRIPWGHDDEIATTLSFQDGGLRATLRIHNQ